MRTAFISLTILWMSMSVAIASQPVIQPVMSIAANIHIYKNQGQFFVIGSQKALDEFLSSGQLTKSYLLPEAGPLWETVYFEINDEDPDLTEQLQEAFENTPLLVVQNGKDFFVWRKHGRLYVIGSMKSNLAFMNSGHLPYTRTLLGAGPMGETVVFEVNKKDTAYADRLEEQLRDTAFLVKGNGEDYFVFKMGERLHVIGEEITSHTFLTSGFLPYTRTILGGGPLGETVIIEVNKLAPAMTERLHKQFDHTPFFVEGNGVDYFVFKSGGRFTVIGRQDTCQKLLATGHLPYKRTLLGAGPNGETVVFEINKDNPALTDRLIDTYKSKGTISH